MYKTIRHGENSLQYTILPQNDDFRVEGKLSSAGSSSSSGSSRKSRAKRPKRRSFFAYLGLIFVCTVIIGAILIPFLVSAECLPNPTEWFLKTKAALTKGANGNSNNGGGGGGSGKELNHVNGSVNNIGHNNVNTRNLVGNGINIGKTVKIINKDGVEKIILRVNKTSINDNSNTEDGQSKSIESAGNINTSNKTNRIIEKLSNGNAALNIVENGKVKQTKVERNGNGEKVIDGVAATNAAINDNGKTVSISSNDEPLMQNEHFVNEIHFGTSKIMSAIAPTTLVMTTLRSNYDYNNNNDNSNNNNQVDITNPNNNIGQQVAKKQQYIAAVQTASAAAPVIRPTSTFSATSVYSPHAPSNANSQQNQDINSAPAIPLPTITTRIIQVPLLKSAAKKPIIPPVLVKTNSELSTKTTNNNNYNAVPIAITTSGNSLGTGTGTGDTINNLAESASNAENEKSKNYDWVHSHWPYIDPSTYFQWTGYKAEDSVLLPALLGFALIGMILIITVCLVARNKRTIVSSVRKRNNDIEETGADDNATLLAPANLSDED